jgi:predicted small secreted protein
MRWLAVLLVLLAVSVGACTQGVGPKDLADAGATVADTDPDGSAPGAQRPPVRSLDPGIVVAPDFAGDPGIVRPIPRSFAGDPGISRDVLPH